MFFMSPPLCESSFTFAVTQTFSECVSYSQFLQNLSLNCQWLVLGDCFFHWKHLIFQISIPCFPRVSNFFVVYALWSTVILWHLWNSNSCYTFWGQICFHQDCLWIALVCIKFTNHSLNASFKLPPNWQCLFNCFNPVIYSENVSFSWFYL